MDGQHDEPFQPDPLCACGCATRTPLAKTSDNQTGRAEGQPLRYCYGHHRRISLRYVKAPGGYETDCWIWQLAKNAKGYGIEADGNGGAALAHKRFYERAKSSVPASFQIDHLCRVRACVNPDHMEAVTPGQNVQRGMKAKLMPNQVTEIRNSVESRSVLAARYGIGLSQVSRIQRRESWKNL